MHIIALPLGSCHRFCFTFYVYMCARIESYCCAKFPSFAVFSTRKSQCQWLRYFPRLKIYTHLRRILITNYFSRREPIINQIRNQVCFLKISVYSSFDSSKTERLYNLDGVDQFDFSVVRIGRYNRPSVTSYHRRHSFGHI